MSSSRVGHPLAPRNLAKTLTAVLAASAGVAGRALGVAPSPADTFAPATMRPADGLQVLRRPGLPPTLGRGGQPVPLVGFNLYPPHATLCGIPDEHFDAALEQMVYGSHANALRMWAFEGMSPAGDWSSLDHAVDRAQSHGMSLTLAVANQWGDCEPGINPSVPAPFKDVAWYETGYKASYRAWAGQVAQRYRNATSVSLQLVNEAVAGSIIPGTLGKEWECLDETRSARALQAFTRDMVDVVHSVAPHMLVSLGTRGQADECGIAGENYARIAEIVDVCEIHSYELPTAVAARRMQQCFDVGKPIFMGESASYLGQAPPPGDFPVDGPMSADHTPEQQAGSLVSRLRMLHEGGLAGTHFWWFQTNASEPDDYSLGADHPVHSMLRSLSAADLVASAASLTSFRQTVAALPVPDRPTLTLAPARLP